jgi:hypothetical protein
MIRHRITAAVATLVAAVSLAACSVGVGGSDPETQPATQAPAATQPAGGSESTGAGQAPGNVLASFPIPPGATVAARNESADGVSIRLASISADDVAAFYRQALPQAGYTILGDARIGTGGGVSVGGLRFEGHGYQGTVGSVAAGLGGGTVGITLQRK